MTLRFGPVLAGSDESRFVQKPWFLTRTAHFNIYSCGPLPETYKLAARLEQFCDAYSILAGTNAVASPLVVVMAFPDHESMQPFLPLYQGKPGGVAGFFARGSDENLIVLALPSANSGAPGLDVIFHEYAHLLFCRNDQIWPLWLKEGMAEIYSTFETTGNEVQIARPIDHHLRLLVHEPLMPLHELFAVTSDSPQYNESTRQGILWTKHLKWDYEQEWRVVQSHAKATSSAASDGTPRSLLRFDPSRLLRVIFGLHISPTVEAKLREMLGCPKFKNVRKEKVGIDPITNELISSDLH